MKKIIVLCSALALSPVLAIHAQKIETGPITLNWAVNDFAVNAKVLRLEARVVKGLPYSAEIVTESIQTLADGNRIVQRTTGRVFRDGEGRVRREEDRPSGSPAISILDTVAGVNISLEPATRTARETSNGPSVEIARVLEKLKDVERLQELKKFQELREAKIQESKAETARDAAKLAAAAVEKAAADYRRKVEETVTGGRGVVVRPRAPGKLDEQTEDRLPDRLIEGVLASGVRRTTTIPSGAIGNEQPIKIVSEEWTSPDLQILVMTDRTDPRVGHSTYRLRKIVRGDPDPALFQVPADYTLQRTAGRGGRGAGAVIERLRER